MEIITNNNGYQHTDTIFTVEDFLTMQECQEYMVLSESIGYEVAKVNTTAGARVVTNIEDP